MRLLGYTRVSTASQDAQLQLNALDRVGVEAGRVLGYDLGQQVVDAYHDLYQVER